MIEQHLPEKYVWKSFANYPIFSQGVEYPKQGKLGNCYWISPLVSVFAFNIIQFCIDGEWQIIEVEHTFPYDIEKNKPAYCSLVGEAIWAMILEKAWAQFYGSYELVKGGFNRTTFKVLTGAPTNKFRTQDSQFFQILQHIQKMQFPLAGNSKKIQSDKQFAKNHAYSILNINDNSITVRNPWGTKSNDQQIISWQEFQNRFASIEVCYHFDNYQFKSEKVQSQPQEVIQFLVEILEPGNYFFTINQKNKRWFRNQQHLQYKISEANINLLINGQIVNSCQHKSNKELWINWCFSVSCIAYVQCCVNWKNIEINEFIFNIYGPNFIMNRIIVPQNHIVQSFQQFGNIEFVQRDAEQEQIIEENNLFLKQEIQQNEKPLQDDQNQLTYQNEDQVKNRNCSYCLIF